jgi:hypothetical protein
MGQSEVAQLREQIQLEMEAMRRAVSGFAQGTARHAFIQARLQRIGLCREVLVRHVGETSASQVVCSTYMHVMEDTPLQTEDKS